MLLNFRLLVAELLFDFIGVLLDLGVEIEELALNLLLCLVLLLQVLIHFLEESVLFFLYI